MSTTNTSSSSSLPPTYRALQIHSASEPATIVTKPSPSLPPPSGTVILKPLQAIVVSYASEFLQNGNPRGYMYPLPLVPGPSCVGRVVAVPPDAPALKPGQLVFLDSVGQSVPSAFFSLVHSRSDLAFMSEPAQPGEQTQPLHPFRINKNLDCTS